MAEKQTPQGLVVGLIPDEEEPRQEQPEQEPQEEKKPRRRAREN